jgi:hypothetical protein
MSFGNQVSSQNIVYSLRNILVLRSKTLVLRKNFENGYDGEIILREVEAYNVSIILIGLIAH